MPNMTVEDIKKFYGYHSDAVDHRVGCSWRDDGPCHCGLLFWLSAIREKVELSALYPSYYREANANSEVLISVQDIRRA